MEVQLPDIVAFTGHRDIRFAAGDDLTMLEERLGRTIQALYASGYRRFMSGMARGFDMVAARSVLGLRQSHPDAELIAALPFAGQAKGFPAAVRREYDAILASADRVEVVSDRYGHDVFLRRDDYMVERAALFVTWFDGRRGGTSYTVARARARGLRVINLYSDGQRDLFGMP